MMYQTVEKNWTSNRLKKLEEEFDNESTSYCYTDITLETENIKFKFRFDK
jgi:uncharacterized protein Veg